MKNLQITPHDTMETINKKFNDEYSMLSMKFYKHKHEDLEGSPLNDEVTENYHLININKDIASASIDISADRTVSDVEQDFEEVLGLHIQICRKSGDTWLQTSATDHWPLSKHQSHAEEMEAFHNKD